VPGLNSDIGGIILAASPITKLILILLLLFSVFSWAIIFQKFVTLRKIARENRDFLAIYPKIDDFAELRKAAARHRPSTLAAVCAAGLERFETDAAERNGPALKPAGAEAADAAVPGTRAVARAVKRSTEEQVVQLEGDLGLLASCGNTAPFIGLLGTVLGIIDAFQAIGRQGTASIAAVAPGIAEALVATAAGLFVAIPAVMAFNYFSNRIRVLFSEMQGFGEDLVGRIEDRLAARARTPREVGRR
jgi:biopolymer transport protein TolQ